MESSTVNDSEYFDYGDASMNSSASTPSSQIILGPLKPNVAQAIAFACSTFLIITSNTLTLMVLHLKPSCFVEISRLIFQALAVTDLLTGLFCCFFSFLFSCAPQLQNTVTCTVRTMACTGCLNQSALTMAFATVDRYIAITKPLRYTSIMTAVRAQYVLSVLAFISIGNAIFTNVGADFTSTKRTCVSDFSAVGIGISFRPSLVVILLIFYGSLLISTFANYNVVRIALRHSRSLGNESSLRQNGNMQDGTSSSTDGPFNMTPYLPQPVRENSIKMRSLWTVVMATISFYILVMPWNIMASLHFAHHVQIPHSLRITAAYLLINNSWWNTVIYSLLNTTFRRALGKTLIRVFGRTTTSDVSFESTIAATDGSLNMNMSP
ncbi:probable G-protein coupled receptor 21 [Lytechinus variegatus]|uniref:probable G-protein coupled receptor 21 n=1 Tax=Lytechinus variegatus TaxID=7654 RepID=UPI001BB2212A|nr:probable G-protein coupled receptor 21 [Lytechinus variegatus]